MNDERMAELAEKLDELRMKKKTLESKIESVQRKICDELERREASGIKVGGYKITWVQQERVEWFVSNLKDRIPANIFKRVTKPMVDKEAMEEAIMSGQVKMDVVAECTRVTKNKPYALVSPADE